MIFRALAITTVIAGLTFTEGAIIYFYENKTKTQKAPSKENNKKPQKTVSKSSKK